MKQLSLEGLKSLFTFFEEQSTCVFWIRSKSYQRQLYLSPNYESVFGHSAEALYKNPESFISLLHPDDQHHVVQMHQLNSYGEEQTVYLYRVISPVHGLLYVKDWHYLLIGENKEQVGVAGFAQVIDKAQWEKEKVLQQIPYSVNPTERIQQYVFDILKNELHLQAEPKKIEANVTVSFHTEAGPLSLTAQEAKCLSFLLQGKSGKQTAAELNISVRTVEFHLNNIRLKAKCRTKLELLSKVKQA